MSDPDGITVEFSVNKKKQTRTRLPDGATEQKKVGAGKERSRMKHINTDLRAGRLYAGKWRAAVDPDRAKHHIPI